VSRHVVDRPLRVGELFAETVRLYGERIGAALALGALFTLTLAVGLTTYDLVYFVLVTLGFGATYAAAVRVAGGDSLSEACSQVVVRSPILLVLCVAVCLPFVASLRFGIVVLAGAAWLAFSGFAIPVLMLEGNEAPESWFARLGFALNRAVELARTEYLHALGVIAALLLLEWFLSVLVGGLLRGVADNSALVAAVLAGIILWPLVFFGLSVLYFEQRARRDAKLHASG